MEEDVIQIDVPNRGVMKLRPLYVVEEGHMIQHPDYVECRLPAPPTKLAFQPVVILAELVPDGK